VKVLIARSVPQHAPPCGPGKAEDAYTLRLDTRYADRVIGQLGGDPAFCTACGPECVSCRAGYGRIENGAVAGFIDFPAALPHVLEDPASCVAALRPPPHDVVVAVAVHEQILIEILHRCPAWGARGLVAPIEAPGWISAAAQAEARRISRENGIEVSFPKPFCAFDPPTGGVLAEFRASSRIGRPEVAISVADGRIADAKVVVSSPCGATYHVARWLVGRSVSDALALDVVGKRLQSYPCTASMEWDDEIGDTIMHVALSAHTALLDPLGTAPHKKSRVSVPPAGHARPPAWTPAMPGMKIDQAREAILCAVGDGGSVPLGALKDGGRLVPAAVTTALLQLKSEGRVTFDGRMIRRTFHANHTCR
jgi:thymidylate synthase